MRPSCAPPPWGGGWAEDTWRQLYVAVFETGIDGLGLQLRGVEGIDAYVGVVHGLLGAQHGALNVLAAFVASHCLVGPVRQHVVAADPNQVLVTRDSGEMPGHDYQD
jgi:hypothetical protein